MQTPQGHDHEPGLNKVKEVIAKRFKLFAPTLSLETEIFDNPETVKRLCLMSGGHIRNLMLLMQSAINYTENLPITARSVQRAITETRDTYRRTVQDGEWDLLAEVAKSKQILNNDRYRSLLFNRCILQYCCFDNEAEMQPWYDVNPLIKGIYEFRDALAKIQP